MIKNLLELSARMQKQEFSQLKAQIDNFHTSPTSYNLSRLLHSEPEELR